MKNPIRKRLLRELRTDWAKYIAIFLFMTMLISLVSGFLVADNSMISAYHEGFTKYNIEDGHIAFDEKPDAAFMDELSGKAGVTFYDMQYIEQELEETGANVRIYADRDIVNLECLMEGEMPSSEKEIVIDRMFANNNQITVGDSITLNRKSYTVVGFVALPDYSCLFESNSDMMFDAINFCVGVMTQEGMESVKSGHYVHNYAWKYDKEPKDDIEANQFSEDFLDVIEDELTTYDKAIIQKQVDELVAAAEEIAEKMSDDFEDISDELETKIKSAGEEIAKKKVKAYVASISQEQMMARFMANPTLTQDQLMKQIVSEIPEEKIKPSEDEIADKLEVDRTVYHDLMEKLEDMEDADIQFESVDVSSMDLDEAEDEEAFDSSRLDDIKEVINLLEQSGLCDVSALSERVEEIDALIERGIDKDALLEIDDYLPRYQNQAINFTGEDMGSDKAGFLVLDYIVIVILAFMFGVTTLNTIAQEAGVIGTLRASGYTKGELIRHYMALPILVTFVAAIVGNILGYSYMKNIMIAMYYNSYSLCTYTTLWNAEAFIDTTLLPMVLMLFINYFIIVSKLKLSPLRFLRHDISKRAKKKAVRLNTKIPFMHRFRMRILFQNIPSYLTLFAGIFLAGFLAIFGFMFLPMLAEFGDMVLDSKIASYQYVLKEEVETGNKAAEKYCMESLDTMDEEYMKDTVSIYGIEKESKYVSALIPEKKVLMNNGLAAKFGLKEGDEITLKDPYSDKTYTFEIGGVYTYDASLSIFMNREEFNELFGKEKTYFTGYFSNEELTDLDSENVYSIVTEKDLLKLTNQLTHSFGSFMGLIMYFAVAMFILLMFILTKLIIEKNAVSISMIKILGFTNREIAGLYLLCTSFVVLASLFAMIPIINIAMKVVFVNMLYKMISGYFPIIITNACYVKTITLGMACYLVVCIFLMRKINHIPKSDALKMVE